jgi:DNA-directed RNA polymerase specialized sigma subunit|tara:strand:+ start:1532 stop:1735 length:204 start_codon:yes stop_codon:yes gene_type:complete
MSKKDCEEEESRSWIDYPEDDNCIYVAIEKHGAMTLDEVSKRLGISLVRVSQIEKQALKKLSKRIKK